MTDSGIASTFSTESSSQTDICCSIIVPVGDDISKLDNYLVFLNQARLPRNYEVVIVSGRGLRIDESTLGEGLPPVRVLNFDAPLSEEQLFNKGAIAARGKFLLFVKEFMNFDKLVLEEAIRDLDASKDKISISANGNFLLAESSFYLAKIKLDGGGERVDISYGENPDFGLFDMYQKSHYRRYEYARSVISPGQVIGDFACGTGYGSAMLAEDARRVTGADINEDVINLVRRRYACVKNAEFVCANLLHITYRSIFDCIVSFETVEHLKEEDIPRLFGVFSRALKPGGTLIFSTPYRQARSPNAVSMGFHQTFDIDEEKIRRWLSENGLVPECFKYQNYQTHNIEDLLPQKDFIICLARSCRGSVLQEHTPKVSILIPTFNRANYLKMAVDSVIAQTCPGTEVLVLDDCSTDETMNAARAYSDAANVRFIRNENNLGFIKNWNKAVSLSSGEYIKIMGDDDILCAACVAEEARILDEHPDVGVVCCNCSAIDENGRVRNTGDLYRLFSRDMKENGREFIKNYLLGKRAVGWPGAILFRRQDIDKAGGFDPEAGCAADIDMWSRILRDKDFYYLDKMLAYNRQFPGNLSRKLQANDFGYRDILRFYRKTAPCVEHLLDESANREVWSALAAKIMPFYSKAQAQNRAAIKEDIDSVAERRCPGQMHSPVRLARNAERVISEAQMTRTGCDVLEADRPAAQWTPQDQRMLDFYSQFISPGDVCFDVGANIGNRTKIFLKLGAKVVAVEPQDDCVRCLEVSYGRDNNLRIIQKVLGESQGQAELMVCNASTISSMSREWIDSVRKSGRFSNYSWDKTQTVSVTTLDQLVEEYGIPAFTKIDVEGFEYEVLKGLSQPLKFLSLEFTPEFIASAFKCIEHLQSLGQIQLNYSLGETMQLVSDKWISPEEMVVTLKNFGYDNKAFGDIYVKFLNAVPVAGMSCDANLTVAGQTDGRRIRPDRAQTGITALVFSKDRAMQLQATIESFILQCRDNDTAELVVLFKASNQVRRGQYKELEQRFPAVNFIEENDFRRQVLSLLGGRSYVLFLVDDNIFVRPFRLRDVMAALDSEKNAVGFSLRLGRNTDYCYSLSSVQKVPRFECVREGVLRYCWPSAEHDFGYPLEVSSSVYRSSEVLNLLSHLEFSNPNTLEGAMNQNTSAFAETSPYLLTLEESVTFCNPVNAVQNVYKNNKFGTVHNYTSEQLADCFSRGMVIDVRRYVGLASNSAHQEVELYLRPADPVVSNAQVVEAACGHKGETLKPKFSIVMANYNNGTYIAQAIESVLRQTFKDWELIIVDDCSSDASVEVIKRYLTDARICLIQHDTNKGYVAALKTGIAAVRSELFGILDSDDALMPRAAGTMYQHHVESPDCGLIYSQFVCCDAWLKPRQIGYCRGVSVGKTNLEEDVVSHFKTFRRSDYLKTDGYDESILYAEDRDISYKMEEVTKLRFVNECLYLYRELPGSQGHDPRKVAIGLQSMYRAKANARIRRKEVSGPADIFLKAREEFNNANYYRAGELIHQYRASIDYSTLPRIINHSRSKPSPDLSVIIVTYDRPVALKECLESLSKQDDPDFEVIVVDNGKTDPEPVRQYFDRYVKCPVNFNLSEGRNIGVCCAKGRIVAFLDDDALAGPDFVRSIKAAFKTYDIFGLRGKALPKSIPQANKDASCYDRGNDPFPTFCDLEGCSAFRRDIFLSMNGMDPLLFGHEGIDLTYRIAQKFGALNKVVYWPFTIIYHDDASAPRVREEKKRGHRLEEQYLGFKHGVNVLLLREEMERDYLPGRLAQEQSSDTCCLPQAPAKFNTDNIPVVLMVYNRPKHTLEVLKALRQYGIRNIYIFSDAPKTRNDEQQVSLVRRLVHSIDWTRPKIIERQTNLGLARSIVSAVDHVFEHYDKLILLEDDCVPQEYFFDFVYTCLEKYKDNPKVFGVTGYAVSVPDEILKDYPYDLYFCPRIGSWGWATWKRAWQHYGGDVRKLVEAANEKEVDLAQGGTDFPVSIEKFLNGRLNDVWDVNWALSVYLKNGYYIYPTRSHIKNVGMDGTGVHCNRTAKYDAPCSETKPSRYPQEVFVDDRLMANFKSHYQANAQQSADAVASLRSARSRKALKVAYVSTTDKKGGAAKVAWMLKQGLKERGFTTRMFVKDKHSDDGDVQIITSPILDGGVEYKKRGLLYYDIKSTALLARNPDFVGSDIFHFHNLHGDYFNPFALSGLSKLRPSVWTLHDMQAITGHCAHAFDCTKWRTGCGDCPNLETYPGVCCDQTAEMLQHKARMYQDSDVEIIVPSQWLKDIVEKSVLRDKKVHLIYNGIDEQIYRPYDKSAIRRELRVPEDAIVVGFASPKGLSEEYKGGDFILEAYKYFVAKYPNVYFLCIGGRAENAPTERFLQIPFVTDEAALARIYCAADLFMYPSIADNCPLIMLELMGCGVPVVSFNTGGVPELIEHGKTGLVTGYKNTTELIQLTERLAGDADLRAQFSRASVERLRQRFTLHRMLDEHTRLYEKLVEQSRPTGAPAVKEMGTTATIPADSQSRYLVSAIVSTFNSERFISGCLEDLEKQTIADKLEIIVVNSGSQQNEEQIVKEFQQKYGNIVYVKTEQREGIYSAWNRAVRLARGEFLTSANTDDRHREDALEVMAKTLQANADTALVYGDQIVTDTPNATFESHHAVEMTKWPEFSRQRLLFGCCVGSQPMWRKSLHDEFGGFDETLTCAADWDFWLKIAGKYSFKHIPEFLGLYYLNKDGIEHGRRIHSLYERYSVGRRYGNPYIPTFSLYKASGNPLVSVVMAAYNAADYIARAIESVLIQNYRNFELIIVDDGSTDRTADIVRSFKDEPIKYFYKENGGAASARNFALKKSSGSFIVILDSDDMMTPDFLARHLHVFEQHPDMDLVYCDDCFIDEEDKPIRVMNRPEYSDQKALISDLFRCGWALLPFRTCIRKSVFDKIGLYDERLIMSEDYDMVRRFVNQGLKMQHLPAALYLRHLTANSLSRSFNAAKAKGHFNVVRKFAETFTAEQLFPDVRWDKLPAEQKPLLAKCKAAIVYLGIGEQYLASNAPDFAEAAFEMACAQLDDCCKIEPANRQVRNLREKCLSIRAARLPVDRRRVCQPV